MTRDFVDRDSSATGRWLVVADGARARVFEAHTEAPGLRPALPYDLIASRLRDGERWSDRAGSSHVRKGDRVHSMAAATDPSEHQADLLAREVAAVLHEARVAKRMDSVVLVAAPAFLGRLRHELDAPTTALVAAEDDHDLSDLPDHELETRLGAELWPRGGPPSRRRS